MKTQIAGTNELSSGELRGIEGGRRKEYHILPVEPVLPFPPVITLPVEPIGPEPVAL